ncbi:MAG: hypothetical protein LJF06_16690 [Gemmatimonadetes bacterium]|nr:hypothetical protein [Gemmatimonadota bacterium]
MSLHYFAMPPDLPAPLSDITTIRQFCRQQLGEGGAIVEVEAVTLGRCSALSTILKMSQEPAGMTYVAALTIPFAECSFVAKVVCPEIGVTGMRDAVVAEMLDAWEMQDWFADPYLPDYRNPVLRNRSDDTEWDATFPDHPLSRARRHLKEMAAMTLSSEVEALAPFPGPLRRPSIPR